MSKFFSRFLAVLAVVLMVVSILSIVASVVVMAETTSAMSNWSMTPQGMSSMSAWTHGGEYAYMPRDVAPAKSMLGVCEYKASTSINNNTCNAVPVLAMMIGGIVFFFVFMMSYFMIVEAADKTAQNAIVLPALYERPSITGTIYPRSTPLIDSTVSGRMYLHGSVTSLVTTIEKVVAVYACDFAEYPNHFVVETVEGKYYDVVVQ